MVDLWVSMLRLSSPYFVDPYPVQLLKSSDLGRHSLLYLKEIGHGWFGKVRHAVLVLDLQHSQAT